MANNLGKEMEKAFAEVETGLARNDDSSSEEDVPTQVPMPPQAITQGPQDLSIQLNVTKSNIPPSPKATTSVPPVRRESPRLCLQRLKEEQKRQKKAAPKKKNKTSPTLPPKASNKTTTTSNTTTKENKGKAPKTTKGNGGPGRVRGRNFTEGETWYLLDIISAVEPAGQHDWDRVTEAYNEHFNDPERMRDRESLKRRFGALHGRKIPTGDPDCPKEVKAAKRILIEIQQRCDVGEKPGKRDLGFDSLSTDESLQNGDADYGEDNDEEEEDNHGEKQDKRDKQDNLETPRTSLSKPLRSATKKRRKHATENEDGTDAIMKYMMVSQQQRQEADEKERAFRREKEDERREREDARAQQAMAMQQSMFQMMMQQQTNMLMLLAPRGQQFQQQQVQPQQLQHELVQPQPQQPQRKLVQPQNITAEPATHKDHTRTTSDNTNNDKNMEEHDD